MLEFCLVIVIRLAHQFHRAVHPRQEEMGSMVTLRDAEIGHYRRASISENSETYVGVCTFERANLHFRITNFLPSPRVLLKSVQTPHTSNPLGEHFIRSIIPE